MAPSSAHATLSFWWTCSSPWGPRCHAGAVSSCFGMPGQQQHLSSVVPMHEACWSSPVNDGGQNGQNFGLLHMLWWRKAGNAQEVKLMVHTPDCASLHKVKPIPWTDKQFNATLIGNSWQQLYPLRHTMDDAIRSGLIHGGELLPHPGCALSTILLTAQGLRFILGTADMAYLSPWGRPSGPASPTQQIYSYTQGALV